MAKEFLNFQNFLDLTSNDDRQFLTQYDFYKLPACLCAMANGSGGWLILGAEQDNNFNIIVHGLSDDFNLNLSDELFSHKIFYKVYELYSPKKILILNVKPSDWYTLPISLNGSGFAYRRFENENFISGLKAKILNASDALNFPFDDEPAENINLNVHCLEQFKNKILSLHPELEKFFNPQRPEDFLKRCFIMSGNFLTRAGFLMFGEHSVNVKADFHYKNNIHLEAHNLWHAYNDILPRLLTPSLNDKCSGALKEIFINALIHSDYRTDNNINITITTAPPKITIQNPCSALRQSHCRNFRLMKIFKLLNDANNNNKGLFTVKNYQHNFKFFYDALNFSLTAELFLSPKPLLPKAKIL